MGVAVVAGVGVGCVDCVGIEAGVDESGSESPFGQIDAEKGHVVDGNTEPG